MCRNRRSLKAAQAIQVSIRTAVCERRIDGEIARCPFASRCGHERQREARPDVWFITSATLLSERPDFIPELDGIVIDERFHGNAIGEFTDG